MIKIYCDGACSGNPGPGGWAFVIPEFEIEQSGYAPDTTNNRMEIQACIMALGESYNQQVKANQLGDDITVITDSQYVINTMTKNWARNKNKDLWDELDSTINLLTNSGSKIKWQWVKGHASNPHNNRCDELAVREYKKAKQTNAIKNVDQASKKQEIPPETITITFSKINSNKILYRAYEVNIYNYKDKCYAVELDNKELIGFEHSEDKALRLAMMYIDSVVDDI